MSFDPQEAITLLTYRRRRLEAGYGRYAYGTTAIARKISVSHDALRCWELGKSQPRDILSWQRWAQALGVELEITLKME